MEIHEYKLDDRLIYLSYGTKATITLGELHRWYQAEQVSYKDDRKLDEICETPVEDVLLGIPMPILKVRRLLYSETGRIYLLENEIYFNSLLSYIDNDFQFAGSKFEDLSQATKDFILETKLIILTEEEKGRV